MIPIPLPARIYAGNGDWLISPEEAKFVCERGYVNLDGIREPVVFIDYENGRARVRLRPRDDLERSYAEGNVPTA